MDYPCDACDKTSRIESKNKHLKSLAHTELHKCIRRKCTIENPDFFDRDEVFNEFITNRKETRIISG